MLSTLTRVSSGISGLDEILGGGFPQDYLYMLEGATGTGKTTFGLQFVLEGARLGEAVLYVTLAETEADLRRTAASHGWTLDGVTILELRLPDERLDPDQEYNLFHPAELELGDHTKLIQAKVKALAPRRMVLDALSSLRLLADDPLRHRRQIETLRLFLARHQCTTLFLDELVSNQVGEAQPRSLVHGVITLREVPRAYSAAQQELRVTKLRGVGFMRTWHNYRIRTGGLEVYPALVIGDTSRTSPAPPAKSDLPALDALIAGGLARGRSILLEGPPGCGKSTLALQYAVAAARRGERSLVYLFDEEVDSLLGRGEALGMDLITHVEAGRLCLTRVDPGNVSPGEFAYRVRRQVEEYATQLVIIDSVSGYLNAMPEQRFLALHFHALLSYLNRQGVVTLLMMGEHMLVSSDLAMPVDLSTLVDTVILLRFLATDKGPQPVLCVLKHRAGTHDRTPQELHLTAGGLRIGPPRPGLQNLFQGLITADPSDRGGMSPPAV